MPSMARVAGWICKDFAARPADAAAVATAAAGNEEVLLRRGRERREAIGKGAEAGDLNKRVCRGLLGGTTSTRAYIDGNMRMEEEAQLS